MSKKFIFRDTTLLMVGGHEGWLEMEKNQYQVGETIQARFKWGHNMQTDGLCAREGLSAFLIDAAGEKEELDLFPGDGLFYELSQVSPKEGVWELFVQHDGIISITQEGKHVWGSREEHPDARETLAFTQYAKSLVTVGEKLTDHTVNHSHTLDIIPLQMNELKTGQSLHYKVMFKNNPLIQTEITVACNGQNGYQSTVEKPDNNGKFKLVPEEQGNYLLLIRFMDEEDSVDGLYDKRSYTCVNTFTL